MIRPFFTSLLTAVALTLSLGASAAPQGSSSPAPVEASSITTATGKLNLNSADATTLERYLTGIGKTKAEAIVAYREANGNFASIDELLEVDGIGKTLIDRNRDRVTVN